MPQDDLDRELAALTGESLRTIRRRGFSLVDVNDRETFDPEPNVLPIQTIDWDDLDARRWAA